MISYIKKFNDKINSLSTSNKVSVLVFLILILLSLFWLYNELGDYKIFYNYETILGETQNCTEIYENYVLVSEECVNPNKKDRWYINHNIIQDYNLSINITI